MKTTETLDEIRDAISSGNNEYALTLLDEHELVRDLERIGSDAERLIDFAWGLVAGAFIVVFGMGILNAL